MRGGLVGGKEGWGDVPPRALSIGGSDSGGGGGVQADLKSFEAFGVFGTTVLTAVTAQNTVGIDEVFPIPPELVGRQLDSVLTDLRPAAVKTGMLTSAGTVRVAARKLEESGIRALVVDPVIEASCGEKFLEGVALAALKETLLPLALVATPNLAEASMLAGGDVSGWGEMEGAAREIKLLGPAYVVIKGGHSVDNADDLVYDGVKVRRLPSPRITDRKVHGTGCVFSAAIAAGLARGLPPLPAIEKAKLFIAEGLKNPLKPGHGSYTVNWKKARLSL